MEVYLWCAVIVFIGCMVLNYKTFVETNNYMSLSLGLVVFMSLLAGLLWPLTIAKEVYTHIHQQRR